jgi:uncharacterized protein YeaO (DUF488 family)
MALRQTYLSRKSRLPAEAETVLVMRGRGNDLLAPSEKLLREFNELKKEFVPGRGYASDVHYAWAKSDYERRFRAQITENPAALARLKELAERAKTRDVFLICYEGDDKPCHRKLLLQIAEEEFSAVVDPTPFRPGPASCRQDAKT